LKRKKIKIREKNPEQHIAATIWDPELVERSAENR